MDYLLLITSRRFPKMAIMLKFNYKMHENIQKSDKRYAVDSSLIMRPSSLGGGRILRRTLSVRLYVRPSR